MSKKLLAALLLSAIFVTSCSISEDKLLTQIERRLQKLDTYYAECEAVVFSTEGAQTYLIKQWQDFPSQWRVEVTAGTESQHFICDGKQIWVYQPGIDDFYHINLNQNRGELAPPFMLTGYLEQLQRAAYIDFAGERERDNKKYYVVTYPGAMQGETIRLWLDKKTLFPDLVEIFLEEKPLSRITVKKLELNLKIADGLFKHFAAADKEVSALCNILPLTLDEAKKGWPVPVFMPSYLPDGTSLYAISRVLEEKKEQLIFVYQGYDSFSLVQSHNAPAVGSHGEKARVVQIGRISGSFQQNSGNDLATLSWSNNDSSFILTGSLSLIEMAKIANSLKPDDF